MKRQKQTLLATAVCLFAAIPAFGQTTVVNATITDPAGLPYTGGTMVAVLTLPAGASSAQLGSSQVTGATQRVTLDSTGSFLMNLYDNNVVRTCTPAGVCTPGGTQWAFSVNISPGVPPPLGTGPQSCPTLTTTITGASQTLASASFACPALSRGAGGTVQNADIRTSGATAGRGSADGTMTSTASTFSASGTSTTPATPGGTTTFNNEVVVSAFGTQGGTFTPPGTPTQRISVPFSTGNNEGLWMGDQLVATPGSYAANNGTISSSVGWGTIVIPMIPVAGQTISLTATLTATTTGSTATLSPFAATPGQALIVCVTSFSGSIGTSNALFPANFNILGSAGGTTCAGKIAGASEPGGYTFTSSGTFLAAAIIEYANVAAIDNKLTSATMNFSSADVGNFICAQGLNVLLTAGLSCSTINATTLSSSTTLYPFFMNTQTSAVTNSALMTGPDSTSGFTGALTSLGSAGGTVYVPPGIWVVAKAGQIKLPATSTVNIIGAGAQTTLNLTGGAAAIYAPGGSLILGIPDNANDPIIGTALALAGGAVSAPNDLIQGITIRSTQTGSGSCILAAMDLFTLTKSDLIGCGGDGITFVTNNTIYTGEVTVRQNLIANVGGASIDIASGNPQSNFLFEQNECDGASVAEILIAGSPQQVTISNNQLQFGGPPIKVTGNANQAFAFGPANWINGAILYTAAGGAGPDVFDNTFENSQSLSFNGQVGVKVTGNFFQAAGSIFAGGSTQKNLTMDATNQGPGANFTTTFTGTSGTASCVFGIVAGLSTARCFLNGYAETGAAQTWTFPFAMATTPFLTESGGSCGGFNPSTTATVLTLPANAAMGAETCQIIVEGQTN